MKKKESIFRKYIALILACFVTGFFCMQLVDSYVNNNSANIDTKNKTLIELINKLEQENAELQLSIDEVKQTLAKSEGTVFDAERILELQRELEAMEFAADQTEVEGPGIIITLDDNTAGAESAKATDPQNYIAANYIVHDTNLRYLINDIARYAEAISINDRRIVPSTDIRCVGTVIMVDSVRLAPPYNIRFIGNSSVLEALALDSPTYNTLKTANMPIKVTKLDTVIIPAYNGPITSENAQIAPEPLPEEETDTQE